MQEILRRIDVIERKIKEHKKIGKCQCSGFVLQYEGSCQCGYDSKLSGLKADHKMLLIELKNKLKSKIEHEKVDSDINNGCGCTLAPGQWWSFCGETDMGKSLPALCTDCGGKFEKKEV